MRTWASFGSVTPAIAPGSNRCNRANASGRERSNGPHAFPLSGFQHGRVRKAYASTSENRLQQNGKSFGADCTVILFLLFHEKNGMVHE